MINVLIKPEFNWNNLNIKFEIDKNENIIEIISILQIKFGKYEKYNNGSTNIFDYYKTLYVNFNGKKYFGYDILLDKKINDYEFFRNSNDITIYLTSMLEYSHDTKLIKYPLIYYSNNKKWPPTDNWFENEFINKGPILTWIGYGKGPLEEVEYKNNKYKNLIILVYDNNIKKVINKWNYIKYLLGNDLKDPFVKKKLKFLFFKKICNEILNVQNDNEILNEIILDFESN